MRFDSPYRVLVYKSCTKCQWSSCEIPGLNETHRCNDREIGELEDILHRSLRNVHRTRGNKGWARHDRQLGSRSQKGIHKQVSEDEEKPSNSAALSSKVAHCRAEATGGRIANMVDIWKVMPRLFQD